MICSMDEELIKKVRSELARQGGLARAKALTPQQRRESAIKASKAAAKARTRAAKERRFAMESKDWESAFRRLSLRWNRASHQPAENGFWVLWREKLGFSLCGKRDSLGQFGESC